MNCTHIFSVRRIGCFLLLLSSLLLHLPPSFASDDTALLKAADRVASGKGSPSDEAFLFMENRRVNHLAMEGKLEGSIYQRTQALYDATNRNLAAEAAREAGFSTGAGGDKKIYKPGTDTDVQLIGKDLTAADVARARQAYNKRVETHLRESGLKVEKGTNWAARTETDIMPSPSQMKSGKEFAKSAALINGDGGNMYVSPLAAEAQAKLDAGDVVSVAEGRAYAEEMKVKIEKMKQAKTELAERYRASGASAERDALAVEIRKAESHEAKYIERINRLERSVRGAAAGVSSSLLEAAGARGSDAVHKRAEVAVESMSSHLTEKALRNYADTLSDLAASSTSPERRAALQEAIAGTLKGLPPARQGDALASIEGRLGGDFAKELAAEMKKPAARAKVAAPGTNLLKGAGILSAVLAGYNAMNEENKRTSGNPHYGSAALNFVYDMTLRGTVDAATRDTAAYTKHQVEELKEYYRNRGEDPESLGVKMKIAAEASLKGTAYGTVKGSFELAKISGKWAGGAIVGGAETVIFLAGEALDTLNTLEVSAATLREQGMAQEVQDAKSLRSGKELVGELRRMAALAASQRALLEQNIYWARNLDIHRSRALDELRSRLDEAAQAPDLSAAEKLADGAEKKYPPEFTRIAKYSSVLHSKIIAVGKELAEGKTTLAVAGDVKFIVEEHDRNLDGFKALVEGMKDLRGMGRLGDIADTLASLEEDTGMIAALGEEAGRGSAVMKKNHETWRKAISEYDRIRSSLSSGYSYFYGKKGVPGWMVIKSDADAVTAPDRALPENFGPELGTLQGMKAAIASELKRLPKATVDEKNLRSALERIKKAYNVLLPEYEIARDSLETTNLALERLLQSFGEIPVALKLNVPAEGAQGDPLQFDAEISNAPKDAVMLWNFGDGTVKEGLRQTHSYAKEGKYSGFASLLERKGGKEIAHSEFVLAVSALSPKEKGEKTIAGLSLSLDLNDLLLRKTGLSDIPEGARKEREDVENGYYLNEQTMNTDLIMVFLTPDKKEVKVSLKGANALPDPGENRFLALVGSVAYNKKRSVVGYYLDMKNNLLERSPQSVHDGGTVMNYSVIDSKVTDDPAGTLESHSARLGLGKGLTRERLKSIGVNVLETGRFRISKKGSGDHNNGTWVYGAIIGDFLVNVSFNVWSIRPDQWSPPSFEPDEVVEELLQRLFP